MALVGNQTLTAEQAAIRGQFIEFFENQAFERRYTERMTNMMEAGKARLIVDMNDLLSFTVPSPDGAVDADGAPVREPLGRGVMQRPARYIPLCEMAVQELVLRRQADYLKVDYRSRPVHVGFEGPLGKVLGPRELYARHLNTLVALEGIVTRQSALRPRLLETVHFCPETNKFTRKEYRDALTPTIDPSAVPTVNILPRTDQAGNLLRTELGLSSFLDSQCAMLQEAPEAAPTGQLPRAVELRLDDDMVDTVKAGDRLIVVGIYMPYTTNERSGFQSIILVNNIVHMEAAARTPTLIPSEEAMLQQYAAEWQATRGPAGVAEALSRAIAPSVYGLPMEKRAILLMLVGGVERQVNESHIRGDINVLLVGEPSTAKSQLLRFVLGVAPLALSTTGKGSSGVGLTAAVTVDQYSGERGLSAGAMVLADRGVLCIDEFDKMTAADRVAMHEAMEQQTVTITKASIHATLNARCSVLAAANPVYGFYSVHHKLAFNIGLPESLLSRFDLSFIILDQHTSEHNRRIGSHILGNHMSAPPAGTESAVARTVVSRDATAPLQRDRGLGNGMEGGIPSIDFLRRYLQLARRHLPVMSEEAAAMVNHHYTELRQEQANGGRDGFFVTARTLESIIRLATASAKLRLHEIVDEDDVAIAMELVRASVHAATDAALQRQREKAARTGEPEEGQPQDDMPPAKVTRAEAPSYPGSGVGGATSTAEAGQALPAGLVRAALDRLRGTGAQSAALHEVRDALMQIQPNRSFNLLAIQQVLSEMNADDFTFESTEDSDTVYFL